MTDFEVRLKSIHSRIDAALTKARTLGHTQSVTLVAVSKKQPFEKIEAAYRLGVRDFGENYPQELIEKAELAKSKGLTEIRWHLIGHLQTNKVKKVLPYIFAFHALDSLKLAHAIQSEAFKLDLKSIPCFVQVNIDREPTKEGLAPNEVQSFVQTLATPNLFDRIDLWGLMAIPAPASSQNTQTTNFETANPFQSMEQLSQLHQIGRGYLSMGMSDDFEQAILAGSTHIRVGSSLFGTRG